MKASKLRHDGVPIPIGWGTFRQPCKLVDYIAFPRPAEWKAAGPLVEFRASIRIGIDQ